MHNANNGDTGAAVAAAQQITNSINKRDKCVIVGITLHCLYYSNIRCCGVVHYMILCVLGY